MGLGLQPGSEDAGQPDAPCTPLRAHKLSESVHANMTPSMALSGEMEVRVGRTLDLTLYLPVQETRDGLAGREAGKKERRLRTAYPLSSELWEYTSSSGNMKIKICKMCL